MTSRSLSASLAPLLLAATAYAQGPIVPVSHTRTISARTAALGSPPCASDSEQTTAAGAFSSALQVGSDNCCSSFSEARAGQDSTITTSEISGELSTYVVAEGFVCHSESYGVSEMNVVFDVLEDACYHIVGSFHVGHEEGGGQLELREVGGPVLVNTLDFVADPYHQSFTLDQVGVLAPGRYRLQVHANGDEYADDDNDFYLSSTISMAIEFATGGGPGSAYCVAAANSNAATGARIQAQGSTALSANDFQLSASDAAADAFGLFYYGSDQLQTPFGDGFRCVGGSVFRLSPPVQSDSTGSALRTVDLTAPPVGGGGSGSVTPGSTWNFQYWFRDAMGPGGSGFNTSDGVAVTFCP